MSEIIQPQNEQDALKAAMLVYGKNSTENMPAYGPSVHKANYEPKTFNTLGNFLKQTDPGKDDIGPAGSVMTHDGFETKDEEPLETEKTIGEVAVRSVFNLPEDETTYIPRSEAISGVGSHDRRENDE